MYKSENKKPVNIMLSPSMITKLSEMHKNARRIYGHDCSRSAIIEQLILDASDRETQIKEEIRKTQRRLCELSAELNAILESKQQEELKC